MNDLSHTSVSGDLIREFNSHSFGVLLRGIILRRNLRPIISLRLCQAARQLPFPFSKPLLTLGRLFHKMTCSLAGVDLPWETSIGEGFAITHGWGLVIAPGAKIGRNVTVFHGVTLGRRDRIAADGSRSVGYPIIEDEVWIGPHAIVVGEITIGRGSRIAGGACVYDTVPPYCVVLGNPAKVVKSNCTPDVPNRLPD